MIFLADTSVLLRFIFPDDPRHVQVLAAINRTLEDGDRISFTPQVARELWAAMTRPRAQNGMGMSPAEAKDALRDASDSFDFLDDVPGIFEIWQKLVTDHGVSGRQVHDANHVAAAMTHGLAGILTLDERDFRRYPGITIVHP